MEVKKSDNSVLVKYVLVAGAIVLVLAGLYGVYAGLTTYSLMTSLMVASAPQLAVVQALIAGVFGFIVAAFIGSIAAFMVTVIGAFIIAGIAKKKVGKRSDATSAGDGRDGETPKS